MIDVVSPDEHWVTPLTVRLQHAHFNLWHFLELGFL